MPPKGSKAKPIGQLREDRETVIAFCVMVAGAFIALALVAVIINDPNHPPKPYDWIPISIPIAFASILTAIAVLTHYAYKSAISEAKAETAAGLHQPEQS